MNRRKRRSSAPVDEWGSVLSALGLSERQQRILFWAGSTVAVLALALVLTLVVNAFAGGVEQPADRGPDGVIGQGRPDSYQAWPSVPELAPIDDRKADKGPLTAREVFGARTFTAGKVTLRRVAVRVDDGCAGAVWGSALTDALARAGCTRAIRGLYRTADGAHIAQYTIFDLANVKAANGLVEELKTLYRGGWLLSLDPAKARFDGYSEASGHALGHYAGIVWIARADGAEPGEQDDFVMLGLAAREAEKAIYRRVVAVAGLPDVPKAEVDESAPPSEPPPSEAATGSGAGGAAGSGAAR